MNRYIKRALVFTHDEVIEALTQFLESRHQASPRNAKNLELIFQHDIARLEWETEEERIDLI